MKQQKAHYCFKQEAGSDVHKLYIYDDVSEYGTLNWMTWEYEESETSADYFRKALAEIPETATIELHINSCGGSVKEGIAIYNQLKQKKCKEIVAYVDGFAYSIAAVIMQAADSRIMGVGTSLLIHNMWMMVEGNANELRKAADDLDVLMESNRQIFMERVNITEDELKEMLENETYLTPEQAIEMGFADKVDQKAPVQDMSQQLQQQIVQLRREMIAQKSFRDEMKQFCKPQQKEDTDKDDDEDTASDNDKDADNTDDTDGDGGEDTDGDNDKDGDNDEDDEKKQKSTKQYKLAALIGQAAAQYLKER
ncbi:MAG: Clp protease ClpP [Lachnospiraceae bacterium]|nr:Clp protease ClpP [Lachnospiraceae bacterium]MBD5505976.1 Clp protease ClpP [Lachnospiraceae bacterium]